MANELTLEHLKSALAETTLDLKTYINQAVTASEQRMIAHIDKTKAELREELGENITDAETRLLRAFRKWAIRVDARVKVHGIEIDALRQRLDAADDEELGK